MLNDQEPKYVFGGYNLKNQAFGRYYQKLIFQDFEFYGQFGFTEDDMSEVYNRLHLNSSDQVRRYTENYEMEQNIKSFLTFRDQILLYRIISRYRECKGEWKILDDHMASGVSSALDTLANKLRRRKNQNKCEFIQLRGFVRRVNKNECQKFCAKARLLLTFKKYDITTHAENKAHTLKWLAQPIISDEIFISFSLEDYWFYEMKTGINVGAELSAYWDELCSLYRNKVAMKECRDEIFTILIKCMYDNYHYIALVPAIDWKINSMKCAMKAVVDILVDAIDLYYKEQSERRKIVSDKAIFNLYLTWRRVRKEESNEESEEDIRFAEEAFKYELSRRFNEVLCRLVVNVMESFNIFELEETVTLPMREFMISKATNRMNSQEDNNSVLALSLWIKAITWVTEPS